MVSQADRELIRNFVNELRPYLDTVQAGVQEIAKPNRDSVVIGQAVQALMMVRGAGQILMVDGLVSIVGWMVESFEKTQNNPDIPPAEALKRLTGLYGAIDDYLSALDRGEDADAIVLRARTIFEAIPGYTGPLPGVSQSRSRAELSALFDDEEHTAQTVRMRDRSEESTVDFRSAPAAKEDAQPTVPLPTAAEVKDQVEAGAEVAAGTPARIIPPAPQPTDPLPQVDPELREIFAEEAVEIIATLGDAIRDLVNDPVNQEAVQSIQRAAHTLKGAANMTGFPLVAQIGGAIELLFDEQVESTEPVKRDIFELVAVSWKMLRAMLPRLDDLGGFTSPSNSIVQRASILREELAAANAASRPVEVERQPSSDRITDISQPIDESVSVEDEVISVEPPLPSSVDALPAVNAMHVEDAPTVALNQDLLDTPSPSVEDTSETLAHDIPGETEDRIIEADEAVAEAQPQTVDEVVSADIASTPIEPDDIAIDTAADVDEPSVAHEDIVAEAVEEEASPVADEVYVEATPEPADEPVGPAFWSTTDTRPADASSFNESEPTSFWTPGTKELLQSSAPIDPTLLSAEATASDPQSETDAPAASLADAMFAELDAEDAEAASEAGGDDSWTEESAKPQTDLLDFDDTPQTEPFWDTLEEPSPVEDAAPEDSEEVTMDPFFAPVEEPEAPFFYENRADAPTQDKPTFAYAFETLPEDVEAGALGADAIVDVPLEADGDATAELEAEADPVVEAPVEEPVQTTGDVEPQTMVDAIASETTDDPPTEETAQSEIVDDTDHAFDSPVAAFMASETVEQVDALMTDDASHTAAQLDAEDVIVDAEHELSEATTAETDHDAVEEFAKTATPEGEDIVLETLESEAEVDAVEAEDILLDTDDGTAETDVETAANDLETLEAEDVDEQAVEIEAEFDLPEADEQVDAGEFDVAAETEAEDVVIETVETHDDTASSIEEGSQATESDDIHLDQDHGIDEVVEETHEHQSVAAEQDDDDTVVEATATASNIAETRVDAGIESETPDTSAHLDEDDADTSVPVADAAEILQDEDSAGMDLEIEAADEAGEIQAEDFEIEAPDAPGAAPEDVIVDELQAVDDDYPASEPDEDVSFSADAGAAEEEVQAHADELLEVDEDLVIETDVEALEVEETDVREDQAEDVEFEEEAHPANDLDVEAEAYTDVVIEPGDSDELGDIAANIVNDEAFDELEWFEQPAQVFDEATPPEADGAGDAPVADHDTGPLPGTGWLGSPGTSSLNEPTTSSLGFGTLDIGSFLSSEASLARNAELLEMAFAEFPEAEIESRLGGDLGLGPATVFDENSDRALEVEMFETFSIEAEEHIAILNRAGMLLDRDPSATAPLIDIKRALHTIKGAAAAADFMEISASAHSLEDSLATHERNGTLSNRTFTLELFSALEDVETQIAQRKDQIFGISEDEESGGTLRINVARVDELLNTVGELVVNRSSFEERLERLEASIEDLSTAAVRLQRASYLLDREANAEDAIGRLLRGELIGQRSGMHVTSIQGEWDRLEMDRYTEFDRLIRQLAEVGADVSAAVGEVSSIRGDFDTISTRQGRLTTALQDELMGIRMVPISSLAPRLYRVVRRAASRRGKEVNLVIEGGNTPFDKILLDSLNESLLHLLRNAVDHGIEEPRDRQRAGKPELGSIRIRAFRDGSEAVIEIIDDGAGIDHDVIITKARENGLNIPDDISREDALALIFAPGFTTRSEADDISGRGLGLEIVEQTVAEYKGRVAVDSIIGRGTVFSLRLPVMLSVIQAFLVRAGHGEFAIPVANVDYVVDRTDQPLTQIGDSVVVETANEIIPVVDVSTRIGRSQVPVMERDEGWVMVTEIANKRWALVVDELRGQQEIVVKPLGRFLRATPGLMGATILGHGDVALIIDVPALLGVDSLSTRLDSISLSAAVVQASEAPRQPLETAPKRQSRIVLVVDDSLSVRRVVSRTIERHDWVAVLARDGVEALELLEQGQAEIILTDIEMPRMDGFELISAIRGSHEFSDLPIVVLTSRSGDKHRERALDLGANEYLVKPFQEQELIEVIESVRQTSAKV